MIMPNQSAGQRVFIALLPIAIALLLVPKVGFSQMIVAHRGASFDAPENTVSAFEEAWRQNADAVEGDFYFTRDHHVVCIHDEDTLRTGRRKLSVAGSTLDELRQLEFGGWKDARFRGEPLPTFADVLGTVPDGKKLVIELKTGPDIVPLLKKQIESLSPERKNLLIISFDSATVAACKRQMPDIRAHWLTSYKQNPVTGKWRPTASEIAQKLRACGADGLGTKGERSVVTAAFIRSLKNQGMKEFHVWTIDDVDDAQYFRELGAMGITTNRPGFIRQSLEPQ